MVEAAKLPEVRVDANGSPLCVDQPDSISELFARYPDVTRDEVVRIVKQLRVERAKLGADGKPVKAEKAPKAAAAPKAPARKIADANQLLMELGIGGLDDL